MRAVKTLLPILVVVSASCGEVAFGAEPQAAKARPVVVRDLISREPQVAKARPLVERYLISGDLIAGEQVLLEHLKKQPNDDQARYGLGVLQFMQGVEHLMQSLHQHGLGIRSIWLAGEMPFLRLPIPPNPNPEPISYDKMRKIYETLLNDLTRAEATLAKVEGKDVKLPLHMGLLCLDFNGDGIVDEEEAFWKIYARVSRNKQITAAAVEQFAISFDKADVHWLRGYCHLLSALTEFILAHDWKESFERTGHLFFAKVESPFQYLVKRPRKRNWFNTEIADFIAFLHLINYPVKEPARMKSALSHLESVIAQSRENWKAIEAETDDDHEWIPNPQQTGVIPGVRVTQTIIDGWKEFLDEAEAILKGDKLIPHWRVVDGRGINLRKVFTQPKRFDLILWIQGSAAEPFLEHGTKTKTETWRRFQRNLGGNFFGYAIWFN